MPGGSRANLALGAADTCASRRGSTPTTPIVLADAQTNGGLLAAVDGARAGALLEALRAAGVAAVGDRRGGRG